MTLWLGLLVTLFAPLVAVGLLAGVLLTVAALRVRRLTPAGRVGPGVSLWVRRHLPGRRHA